MYLLEKFHPLRGKGMWAVLCLLLTANAAAAQEGNVVFPAREITVARAIEAIEKQTEYVFSYESGAVDTGSAVTFSGTEMPLRDALPELVRGLGLGYTVSNRHIILHPAGDRQAGTRAVRRRTDDIYRKTPADSLSAASLRRTRPSADSSMKAGVHPFSNLPITMQPGLSDFHSSYNPVNGLAHIQERLPLVAVKINLLYTAAALTPNLAAELGLGDRTSLTFRGSYNPWNRIGTLEDNDKLVHWVVGAGARHWFCERYTGHFVGAEAFFTKFNISGHKIPFTGFEKEYRYAGNAVGAGVNYGYHLPLGRQWGLEFGVGVGLARMKYDQFECSLCSGVIRTRTKTYFGPTNAAVSLVFIIK